MIVENICCFHAATDLNLCCRHKG